MISAASDLLVKVNVAADGGISFTGGGTTPSNLDTTRYIDLNDPANPATNGFNAGKNPVGIVINDTGTTAYVNNFVSRNVSVVNLTTNAVSKVIRTTDLPAPGSKNEVVTIGAEQFFASRGHYNQPPGTSISPLKNVQVQGGVPLGDIITGRVFFGLAGCAACHGGNQWTSSILDYDPPPNDAVEGFTLTERTGAFVDNPSGAQYLQRFLRDIKSFDLNVAGSGNAIPGQPLIGAPEKTARVLQANGAIQAVQQDALGKDYNNDGRGIGFSPPSLLGIGLLPPYYHNGACETLACVLQNVNHRTAAGTFPFGDILADPNKRAKVVRFLESIDVKTSPITR